MGDPESWTQEHRCFSGVVKAIKQERGHPIHHIGYDDGQFAWHNLQRETWAVLDDDGHATAASVQLIAAAIADERSRKSAVRHALRDALVQTRNVTLLAFLQAIDDDDLSTAGTASHEQLDD